MSNKSGTSIITKPSGGGAQNGLGEKFSPDLFTGTGNFSVPINLPAGRNGFQPELVLQYSTGNGNSSWGLGWELSIPGIMRQTLKGIPKYDKDDVYVLSGAEDLVPVEEKNGIIQYRPRTEGLFAKIHHHSDQANDYWVVKTKNGLTSFYGTPAAIGNDPATIFDPASPTKVSHWKLSKTVDLFGNVIEYQYQRDIQQTKERHWNQLYLSMIRYADYGSKTQPDFLVSVKLNFNERLDPFSSFRQGFEIRTTKRCERIEIYTHDTPGTLVRSYNLTYLDERVSVGDFPPSDLPLNGVSLLSELVVTGHKDGETESYPPLEFNYSVFKPGQRKFEPIKGTLPTMSLSNPGFELADLFGNGLPDIVEMNGVIRYWRNLGNGEFDLPRLMDNGPAGLFLGDSDVQLIDADGDARVDLMVNKNGLSGYFPSRFGGQWDKKSFQKYEFAPTFSFHDPNVQLIDLTGNGVTDVMRSGSRLECYFNDVKKGWNNCRQVERKQLNGFPNINFSDPRIKWADMSGDGLQDIVLIHDGNVAYWANLGYGNFSRKIHMRNNPRFPYGFDARRILVADVDGDGLADVVYVDNNEITLWINQSGNSWSNPIKIKGTPRVTDMDAVRLEDILGIGTRGVLWTADKTGASRYHYHFLDFTGGIKPYLLAEMNNNMGAVTKVRYCSSIEYYLEDEKRPETKWKTTLPFPVQTVYKVEVIDQISQGKLTTEYRYHHGYWDGGEREFRGFGRVDQFDTEVFQDFNAAGLHEDQEFRSVELKHYSPPLKTSNWFHLGPVGDEFGDWEEVDFGHEYWQQDANAFERDQEFHSLLLSLSRRAKRDAFRVLRGSILRTELFALDGSPRQNRPYTVSENQYTARLEYQPISEEKNYAGSGYIFFPFSLAQRTTQWERGDDPMTRLNFTHDYDVYGQPQSLIEMGVPRHRDFKQKDFVANEPYLVKFTATTFTDPIDTDDRYLIGKIARVSVYDVKNDGIPAAFSIRDEILIDHIINVLTGNPKYEIIGQSFSYYDGNAYRGLPFKQVGDYGVPTRVETLILTDNIIQNAYGITPPYLIPWSAEYPPEFINTVSGLTGYIYHDGGVYPDYTTGHYSISQQSKSDFHNGVAEPRGMMVGIKDPMGNESSVTYDNYQLLPIRVTDPKGLEVTAQYDYRLLQVNLMTDPNGNRSAFEFSPLGLLTKTAVMGKAGQDIGDTLDNPGTLMEYSFRAFYEGGNPVFVRTIKRENHFHDHINDDTITTVEHTDGFGRLLQTRAQAEDTIFGNSAFGDAGLSPNQDVPNAPAVGIQRNPNERDNVVVSGWQIYNNKGKVVEKYEPFFDKGWDFNAPRDSQLGHRIQMFYDPRGNVIRILNPNGSEQIVIYGVPASLLTPAEFNPTPWEAYTYDANDLAPQTHPADTTVPASHYYTPSNSLVDAHGRILISTSRNGQNANDEATVKYQYDIRGNLLEVTDPLGRVAFRHVYDLTPPSEDGEDKKGSNVLNTWNLDAGTKTIVLNAVNNPVEVRSSKGSLLLSTYDTLNRPVNMWAKDHTNETVTLRQHFIFGEDSGIANPENANLNGAVYKQYDEAGLVTIPLYDFKGNIRTKVRRVVNDGEIIGVFNGTPQVQAYRVNWTVDWNNAVAVANRENQLLDTTREFQTNMNYDALNRVVLLTYPLDVDGQRKVLIPIYNRAGNLEQIELDGNRYVNHIAYNAKGQRLLIAYGINLMTRYVYEPQTLRLMRMRTERYTQLNQSFQPNGSTRQDYAYRYDLIGNIITITDRTPGCGVSGTNELTRNFEYDPLNRLTSGTGRECDTPAPNPPWDDTPQCNDPNLTRYYERRYEYDLLGNMERLIHLTQNTVNRFTRTFNYDAGKNTLNNSQTGTANPANYQFDANGNMTRENSSRFFDWDFQNQLKAFYVQANPASIPTLHVHYLYNSGNERVKKLAWRQGGILEVTVYIDGLLDYQYTRQGGLLTEANDTLHILEGEKRIATVRVGNPFANDTTPAVKYNLEDHLGSSNVTVGINGSVINREEYYPYGDTSFESFARKRYRFSGKERDEENGLYYYGARYYAPWLGRWMCCDPAGILDGVNLYLFVKNSPISKIDASGHQTTVLEANFVDVEARLFRIEEMFSKYEKNRKFSVGERRQLIGNYAQRLSINNQLSSVEALARIADYTATFHTGSQDVDDYIDDMFYVLTELQPGAGAYLLTDEDRSKRVSLGQTGFETAFKEQKGDSNPQVRHFVGWLYLGFNQHELIACFWLSLSETTNPNASHTSSRTYPDFLLGKAAIDLGEELSHPVSESTDRRPLNLNEVGDWIRVNIGSVNDQTLSNVPQDQREFLTGTRYQYNSALDYGSSGRDK